MAINTINFDKLKLLRGDSLLDVGCGLGRHSLLAFRDYSVNVYGLDLDFENVAQSKNRIADMQAQACQGEVAFIQGNGYRLPFADASFDKVVCSEVLEHVPDYTALIQELIRVLKPGGRLALSVPKYLPEKICWLLSKDYPKFAGHVRIFLNNQLVNEVGEQGLLLTERHSAHAIHSPYWWLRSLFFSSGQDFLPVSAYQKFLDWQLFKAPPWTENVEKLFNPIFGKSNVYYFEKS